MITRELIRLRVWLRNLQHSIKSLNIFKIKELTRLKAFLQQLLLMRILTRSIWRLIWSLSHSYLRINLQTNMLLSIRECITNLQKILALFIQPMLEIFPHFLTDRIKILSETRDHSFHSNNLNIWCPSKLYSQDIQLHLWQCTQWLRDRLLHLHQWDQVHHKTFIFKINILLFSLSYINLTSLCLLKESQIL